MNKIKLISVVALGVALTGGIFVDQVLASTSQDFTNDVKTGLAQQQANQTIQTDRKDIENGENASAGDSSEKSIPEVNVEQEVEKESNTSSDNSSTSDNGSSSHDSGEIKVTTTPTVSTTPIVSTTPTVTTTPTVSPTQNSGN